MHCRVSVRARLMRLASPGGSIPMSEFTFELRQGQVLQRSTARQERTALRISRSMFEKLTLESIDARAVLVPLRRPVVSKVGLFKDWPLILIDLYTREGIVGRSYL